MKPSNPDKLSLKQKIGLSGGAAALALASFAVLKSNEHSTEQANKPMPTTTTLENAKNIESQGLSPEEQLASKVTRGERLEVLNAEIIQKINSSTSDPNKQPELWSYGRPLVISNEQKGGGDSNDALGEFGNTFYILAEQGEGSDKHPIVIAQYFDPSTMSVRWESENHLLSGVAVVESSEMYHPDRFVLRDVDGDPKLEQAGSAIPIGRSGLAN